MVAVNVITMHSGQVRELTCGKLMLSANVSIVTMLSGGASIPSDNVFS